MSTGIRALTVLLIIAAVGAGLLIWHTRVSGHGSSEISISKEEMEIFVRDFNPMQLKAVAENPDQKKKMLDNLSDILAIGSEARKHGIAEDLLLKEELVNIEEGILAALYDQKVNSGKGEMPPFGFISEDEIKAFWGEDNESGGIGWIWNGATGRYHEAAYEKWIETKLALARKSGQLTPEQEPTEEELARAKDAFARTQISYHAAKAKLKSALSDPDEKVRKEWADFKTKVDLQVRLQQSQLLSTTYVRDVLAKQVAVTEKEIADYIAKHPELTKTAEKKNTATEVLKKVKAGEDFAGLVKEYSNDPGSSSKGGLYEGIVPGQFAPEFEQAVNKLKPGEVYPELVETKYGFHIIKLEKRGETKGSDGTTKPTYDARHILISTLVKDPENPAAPEMPVDQFVKARLEREKQEKALKEIKERNPVKIASDFKFRELTPEEVETLKKAELMQEEKRQNAGSPAGPSGPRPAQPSAGN